MANPIVNPNKWIQICLLIPFSMSFPLTPIFSRCACYQTCFALRLQVTSFAEPIWAPCAIHSNATSQLSPKLLSPPPGDVLFLSFNDVNLNIAKTLLFFVDVVAKFPSPFSIVLLRLAPDGDRMKGNARLGRCLKSVRRLARVSAGCS